MPRAKNKAAAHNRKKKYFKLAKGYWGARSKVWQIVKHHVEKGLQYAYRDRRNKKRTFRSLWIVRINAAARLNGTTYSRLMHAMRLQNIMINRKVLANLAMNHPEVFTAVVKQAKVS
ncbi:50S ribosomal protein L20 [soil metagenome]